MPYRIKWTDIKLNLFIAKEYIDGSHAYETLSIQ